MKNFVLISVFFVLFETTFAQCPYSDKFEKCFQETYGNLSDIPSWASEMGRPLFLTDFSEDYWQPVCNSKRKLNKCLEVFAGESCLNIPDLTEFSFVNNSSLAKFIVATSIETDYICDKIFKLSYKDYKCINDLIPKLDEACPRKPNSCPLFRDSLECVVQTAYKECGKVVGCFQQKNMLLMLCWKGFDFGCDACIDISSENNMIDGLCDDDNDIRNKSVENPKTIFMKI